MEPRKYQVGDRLSYQSAYHKVTGTVTRIWEIKPSCFPNGHYRLEITCDAGQCLSTVSGAEHNFYPAAFWQVWEGETLRANQSTRAGAEHYMRPGRVLVGPGEVRP